MVARLSTVVLARVGTEAVTVLISDLAVVIAGWYLLLMRK